MSAQAFDALLQNRLYIGIIDAPRSGVVGRGHDFDALVDEKVFDRVQRILSARIRIIGPRERNRPDLPLRGLVRWYACEV